MKPHGEFRVCFNCYRPFMEPPMPQYERGTISLCIACTMFSVWNGIEWLPITDPQQRAYYVANDPTLKSAILSAIATREYLAKWN